MRRQGLRIVFDIDDTISRVRTKGDYANAEELLPVTSRIRELKKDGHTIILHTARGMVSCNGDAEAARNKNERTLVEWLEQHNVPYDEIWWGKPYADLYIDDKAVGLGEFLDSEIDYMSGFSGAQVVGLGGIVIKTADNAAQQAEWYKETEKRISLRKWPFNVPRVLSHNFGKITMTKAAGEKAANMPLDKVTRAVIDQVLTAFRAERLEGENDVDWYKRYVGGRAEEIGIDRTKVEADIEKVRVLLADRTYCHGDLSLSNIIVSGAGLTLIDPSQKEICSWLLDASKYQASIHGLDAIISGRSERSQDGVAAQMLKDAMTPEEYAAVSLLERGHWIRVARYAKALEEKDILEKLMAQIREWYG